MAGETGRVTGRREAMGRGDFTDGMLGWTYFSLAMPGHPASMSILIIELLTLLGVGQIERFHFDIV